MTTKRTSRGWILNGGPFRGLRMIGNPPGEGHFTWRWVSLCDRAAFSQREAIGMVWIVSNEPWAAFRRWYLKEVKDAL